MIELRWVWHNMKDRAPPASAIRVDIQLYVQLYQKLQYRVIEPTFTDDGKWASDKWSEWKDVPHSGVVHPIMEHQTEQEKT